MSPFRLTERVSLTLAYESYEFGDIQAEVVAACGMMQIMVRGGRNPAQHRDFHPPGRKQLEAGMSNDIAHDHV